MIGDLPEEDLRLVADLGPQLAAIWGLDGSFLWLSPRWETLLGWPRAALVERPFQEFVHPDDHEATRVQIARLAAGRSTAHFVNRYKDVNGGWVHLEWYARKTPDGRLVCAARDITEQRRALARQQQLVAQLHQAEALAALGHWRVDLLKETVFWSPQVFAIHGRDPALGPPPLREAIDYYHPDDRVAVQAALDHSTTTREAFRFQLRIIRDDGVERVVESRGDVEADSTGTLVGIFGVFQDITEQSLLQQRLRHVERLTSLGTLASGVAHEINNPLTYVIHDANLLEEQVEELADWMPQRQVAELARLSGEIREGARRIKRIVRGLRDMAAPEGESDELINLHMAIGMARRRTELEWRYRAQVVVDLHGDLPRVRGDATQFQQILRNLIVNAAHATPEGRPDGHRIRISAGRRGASGVWLEVQDDGVGMTAEVLARATDPFYTTKTLGGGTGLGLYLVQGFVQSLGGTLKIHSTKGVGTTVRLELPGVEAGSEPAAPPIAVPAPAAPTGSARVYIIDDEALVARAIGRMLAAHDVVVFTDPEEAVRAIAEGDVPDVIFCDLMMGPMSGAEVYAALPAALQARFWVITGGGVTAATRRFQQDMGERVLLKPPDARRLRAIVADVVAAGAEPESR